MQKSNNSLETMLTKEEYNWALRNQPDGGSLVDLFAALIKDAYAEEQDALHLRR